MKTTLKDWAWICKETSYMERHVAQLDVPDPGFPSFQVAIMAMLVSKPSELREMPDMTPLPVFLSALAVQPLRLLRHETIAEGWTFFVRPNIASWTERELVGRKHSKFQMVFKIKVFMRLLKPYVNVASVSPVLMSQHVMLDFWWSITLNSLHHIKSHFLLIN